MPKTQPPSMDELLWVTYDSTQPPKSTRTSSGRPMWMRIAVLGLIPLVLDWGLKTMPAPELRALGEQISPYCSRISTGFELAAAALLVLWLPGWLRNRALGHHGAVSGDAEAAAVADEFKIYPPTRVQVKVRVWLWWRPPFWRLRRATIWLPRGRVTEDPAQRLSARLEPLLGPTHKRSWRPRRGRLVLIPGAAPAAEEEVEVPEASTDPQERAREIGKEILRTDKLRTEPIEHDADGNITKFKLRHPTNIKVASDEAERLIGDRFAKLMPDAPGGRGWRVTVNPQSNEFVIGARPRMPDFLPHPLIDYKAEFGKRFVPFGRSEFGEYVGWDISTSTKGPHCLLSGRTGAGKTSTLRSIAVGASRFGETLGEPVEIWGFDPKMIELMGLEGWPGVTRLAVVISEIASLIEAAHAEMMDRYDQIRKRKVHPSELPVLLVILDEFLILRGQLVRWWKEELGNKGNPPMLGMLYEMLALARVAAVHLCIGIQRPDATNFDDGARDNMRTRVAHDPLTVQGRQMMWDDAGLGILASTDVRGRAMATDRSYSPVESQMFWTPDLDQHPMARRWMSEEDKHLIDSLRPADYTPLSITKEGLWVPATEAREVPEGSVQSEMMDRDADIVRARDLAPGDRIKWDRGGRWETAVVEDNPYQVGDEDIDLEIVWDNGGGGQTLEGVEAGDEVYVVERAQSLADA